jgi:hypothetical protein
MADVSRELHIQGEAARALLLNIRDVVEDDAEMIETAVEGETNLKEAISAAVDRIEECKAHALALESREKNLSDRRQRFLDQAERLKASILVAMGHAEMRKLELPQATLSIRALSAKAQITDESLIPSKFWKPQDPKLDKKAVLDALKAKEAVPGAELSNGGETLSIGSK